jgi:hypothetical protein
VKNGVPEPTLYNLTRRVLLFERKAILDLAIGRGKKTPQGKIKIKD